MKIILAGASGLVGRPLAERLARNGHRLLRLVRRPARGADEATWDPEIDRLDAAVLAGADVVINLAGEGIADGRWNEPKKRRILESRVRSTRLLADRLAQATGADGARIALVNASAIGFYGDRGDELLDEGSAAGTGFLADVCGQWEEATRGAESAGCRVVWGRIGVVLSTAGGALTKMLTPFKLGLGGRIGNGRQYMSWIELDDLVAALEHCATHGDLRGPVNLVAPGSVTNQEFTRTLGAALRRPTLFPFPAFAARLVFGEMADALLLASTRVRPGRLEATGFAFQYPDLEKALRHVLHT